INDPDAYAKKIFHGGPVHTDRGFILHNANQQWDSSIIVSEEICVTTSKDILEAIAEGDGPKDSLIALGYAGWAGGQLEQEIMDNAWLSGPADRDIIFNTPYEHCWELAAGHMGVDIDKLSSDIGHA
ncbi:MAG: YqgE/AlgH family protein, partial [Proteobacteria bacterium]|nr:YqgE/AlgH family protein [Pseudomonadota bacterium]